jgi:cysteine synthase
MAGLLSTVVQLQENVPTGFPITEQLLLIAASSACATVAAIKIARTIAVFANVVCIVPLVR